MVICDKLLQFRNRIKKKNEMKNNTFTNAQYKNVDYP